MKTTSLSGILTITTALLTATAATIRVPQDQPTIQAAIISAVGGDTVMVSDGTYQEHNLTITNAITLKSVNGRGVTTIDAQSQGRVILVNSASTNWVKIQGFTLTSGYAPRPLENCGVAWQAGFLEVSNCIIQNCTGATVVGGEASGLTHWNNLRFVDCIVQNNSVENYAGLGGATVIRCVLFGNSGWNQTAVLLSCDSYNCTIANNAGGFLPNAWTTGGMSGGRAVNCIFWGNQGHNGQQVFNADSVTYSIVQGGYTDTGNLNSDPLFVNAANGDFHLLTNSPAIDTGNPTPAFNDTDGTRADMGAFPFLHPRPFVTLVKAVKPAFGNLAVGVGYQLQASLDFTTWFDQGLPFIATSPSMDYPWYYDVDNWNQVFFRLLVAP